MGRPFFTILPPPPPPDLDLPAPPEAPPAKRPRKAPTPPPMPPLPPPTSGASSSSKPIVVEEPVLLEAVSKAAPKPVEHPLGTKGYGKGNLGTAIPAPIAIAPPADDPAASWDRWVEAQPQEKQIPDPIRPSQVDIVQWLSEFTPFSSSNYMPPEIGQEVLWRGFKQGRSGGISTQVEYFNGTVRDIGCDDVTHECYVYVT